MGEITTDAWINVQKIARDTIQQAGYTDARYGFDAETCAVVVSLHEQSADIAMGVDEALESKQGEMGEEKAMATGAGDQGMMIGFACNETDELMPLTISLAHKLTRRLAELRKARHLDWLRPDGKSQVTVEYKYGKPVRVDAVVISTQHDPEISGEEISRIIKRDVIPGRDPRQPSRREDTLLHQSHRQVRHGRPYGRCGSHRA
jgi:S-adenosylmethionine synthetase